MTNPPAATLRPMVAADLPAGHRLSAAFAWPHRLEDWALMLEVGEGVVAERDGAVAGTAMAWRYGADAATVGMIIVDAALQGMGLGRLMLQHLLDRLDGRTVRLNATPEGLKLYRALGFAPGGRVTKFQVEALPPGPAPAAPIRALAPADLPWVAALDRAACGMDRSALLAELLEAGNGVALGEQAFAMRRRFGRGELVGPVVAADDADATALIGHLLAGLAGRFVRIDAPDRPALAAWLAERGLQPSETVLGMTRGPETSPAGPPQRFALASQAYG